MMDFLLDGRDLAVSNGDFLVCSTDKEALAQAITMRLKTLAGEWFLDKALGVPYFESIFGQKRSERFIRELLISAIKTLPGIKQTTDFKAHLKNDRTMTVSFTASLHDGSSITINESTGM